MELNQAIKPSYFKPIEHIKKVEDQEVEDEIALREEKILASLANHEGWQLFKKIAYDTLKNLNNFSREQMSQGVPLEELGRNALLEELCREIINGLLNKVEDAEESERQNE